LAHRGVPKIKAVPQVVVETGVMLVGTPSFGRY